MAVQMGVGKPVRVRVNLRARVGDPYACGPVSLVRVWLSLVRVWVSLCVHVGEPCAYVGKPFGR